MPFKRRLKDKYAGSSPENVSVVRTLFDLFHFILASFFVDLSVRPFLTSMSLEGKGFVDVFQRFFFSRHQTLSMYPHPTLHWVLTKLHLSFWSIWAGRSLAAFRRPFGRNSDARAGNVPFSHAHRFPKKVHFSVTPRFNERSL